MAWPRSVCCSLSEFAQSELARQQQGAQLAELNNLTINGGLGLVAAASRRLNERVGEKA